MKHYLVLVLLVILQVLTVSFIFEQIKLKDKQSKSIKKWIELGVLILVVFYVCVFYLKNLESLSTIYTITIVIEFFVVTLWFFVNNTKGTFSKKMFLKNSDEISNNYNNNNNKNTKKQEYKIFSDYISRENDNNYSFNDLYPDYDYNNTINKKDDKKDYSAYNGYNKNHVCYGCGCLQREDGYIFCGKFVDGMGAVGCSKRWECENCKKCKEGASFSNNNMYTCDGCKCHNTKGGKICGKRSKVDGYIYRCKKSCSKCEKCKGPSDVSNDDLVTVKPSSNLNKVIINNINKIDIDNIL